MRLGALHAHPIKSLPGIVLHTGQVRRAGLRHDRRWMLVDERGDFVTLRDESRLAEAKVSLADGGYRVVVPAGSLIVPETHRGLPIPVRVWKSRFEAVVHAEGSEFMSQWLHRPLRLVHLPEDFVRRAGSRAGDDDRVSMADGYPYLLMSEASLLDLNARIDGPPMTMARFRPNLVVTGSKPYEEDDWSRVRIGSSSFRVVKRCARCVLITVDPQTGERGREPLRTLASYRRDNGNVLFGVNLVPEGEGELSVGDEFVPVPCMSRRNPAAHPQPARPRLYNSM